MLPFRFSAIACFVLLCSCVLMAQDGQDTQVPLGDVARTVRAEKQDAPQAPVIDNENFSVMMDHAEAERLNGKPVFSIDPSGKTFRMTSPDGSCSLSFDANATALISTPIVTSNLPEDALLRVDGSATIHGDTIEVSVRNATDWELKEIVVGLTVLNKQGPLVLESANLLLPDGGITAKTPDTTLLYHLKASAAPGTSTVFRGTLDQEIPSGTDWHWALVGARGIPPASPGSINAISAASQLTPPPATGSPLLPVPQPQTASAVPTLPQNAAPTPQVQPVPKAQSLPATVPAVAPAASGTTPPHR